MKTLAGAIVVCLLSAISCQNPKAKIFRAIKDDAGKPVELVIYEDYKYTIVTNDSLAEEGKARLTGENLLLAPKPATPFVVLIINQEFRIVGDKLCRLGYFKDSNDTTSAMLVKIVDEGDCFEIKEPFRK